MAGHVGADANVNSRWRREMEVGIKTGYSVNLTEGHAQFRGQQFKLFRGQISEFFLDGTKFWNHAPRRAVR
jgi:hypothetical protein